jgi:hypothetical protein
MTNDLNYTRLEQLKEALESDDPGLGDGGVIVIPEPLWSEASEADQEAFAALAESHGFQYRIERRWQRRPPDGHGITKMSVERGENDGN